ncbi:MULTISPECIES: transporter substrate-binding domain-containing protein [unclassified Kitasatospora]|uniref:transporter substrate-binding domain-containing protein n=1 Tax=unclassified Kitasatospora TaxID=2633591 RepID=UPI0038172397
MKNDQPGTGYSHDYKRSGFDWRVAEAVAGALGKLPQYEDVPSQDRQVVLDGKHGIDLVVATYSINNERLQGTNGLPAHDFAGPYAVTYQGFLVLAKGPQVRTLDDLAGKKVCTWSGTTSTRVVDKRTTGMVSYQAPTASQCVEDLKSGQAAAVSTDQMILYGFTQLYPELTVVPNLHIGEAQYYGIGIPKGNRSECQKIKEKLKNYVKTAAWSQDFSIELSSIVAADPNWQSHYKPSETDIDTFSCRDKVG